MGLESIDFISATFWWNAVLDKMQPATPSDPALTLTGRNRPPQPATRFAPHNANLPAYSAGTVQRQESDAMGATKKVLWALVLIATVDLMVGKHAAVSAPAADTATQDKSQVGHAERSLAAAAARSEGLPRKQ
jgi:hypothetical protein